MKRFFRKLTDLIRSPASFPFILLAICIAAYGLLIPWLGFYSDDWIFIWAFNKMGPDGLTRYFATNRPFLGVLMRLTMPIVGIAPWRWQVFALLVRWLSGLSAWWLLRLTWPRKDTLAAWTAVLICVYPGSVSQPVALTGSHLFLVLTLLFSSFALNILAIRNPAKFWHYTLPALAASLINLLVLDYFFVLELLRIPILFFILNKEKAQFWDTIKKMATQASPYLVIMLGAGIWRAFFFGYQDYWHPAVLVTQLKIDPIQALLQLPGAFFHNIWISSVAVWARPFAFRMLEGIGRTGLLIYAALVLNSTPFLFLFLRGEKSDEKNETGRFFEPIILALACLALAGAPFLVTGLVPDLWTFRSRFNLPFMFGACLLFVAVLSMLPLKSWLRKALFSILVGFCVGQQFVVANQFRLDWYYQNRFYQFFTQRIPQLEEGTLVVGNDFPTSLGGAWAYTSALNWIYAPKNSTPDLSYAFVYGTETPGLLDKTATELDYLAGQFKIDFQKILFVNFNNRCLQVLTADYEFEYPYLEPRLLDLPALSDIDLIQPDGENAVELDRRIFSSSSSEDWCSYYIKADLARQQGNWQEVARLGEEGMSLFGRGEDHELFPFIEANAITGNWQRALALLEDAVRVSMERNQEIYLPNYEGLWNFIDGQTPASPEKDAAYQAWQVIINQEP